MIVAFSVTPLGGGEHGGEYVADAVRVVREWGLPNRTPRASTSCATQLRPYGKADPWHGPSMTTIRMRRSRTAL